MSEEDHAMKKLLIGAAGAAVLLVGATGFAAAEQPEFTEAFVCPVLGEHVGEHGNADVFEVIGGGDLTIIATDPGDPIMVPVMATTDGSPGGAHASPGDTDYTAIWDL
jgi:hypothetical protein